MEKMYGTFGPMLEIFFLGFTVGRRHECVMDCRTSDKISCVVTLDILFILL
jgi:hypothetical protein